MSIDIIEEQPCKKPKGNNEDDDAFIHIQVLINKASLFRTR